MSELSVADPAADRALLRSRYDAFRGLAHPAPPPRDVRAIDPVPLDPTLGLPVCHGVPSADFARSAILGHGSCLVRGLLGRERATLLRDTVVEALRARDAAVAGQVADPEWFSEFEHVGGSSTRAFTSSGGMLAADSPRGHRRVVDMLREEGVLDLATSLLGARPALSVEKTVLRRVEPQIYATWHQDGAFLGERISTLDVWIALTPCGRTAPGLQIFPRRVDRVLPTGAFFEWDLSDETLAREYPGVSPVMPEFEVGDAILFDQLCVHRSGHLAGMTDTRLAIECWLFAPGSVPPEYTGLLL